ALKAAVKYFRNRAQRRDNRSNQARLLISTIVYATPANICNIPGLPVSSPNQTYYHGFINIDRISCLSKSFYSSDDTFADKTQETDQCNRGPKMDAAKQNRLFKPDLIKYVLIDVSYE
uniref:Ephrin RBD domain-containing protein n=1 Tax=Ascaris lumbricoides TaxID=6252 RepID=A0A0M3I7T4_ASCLU